MQISQVNSGFQSSYANTAGVTASASHSERACTRNTFQPISMAFANNATGSSLSVITTTSVSDVAVLRSSTEAKKNERGRGPHRERRAADGGWGVTDGGGWRGTDGDEGDARQP